MAEADDASQSKGSSGSGAKRPPRRRRPVQGNPDADPVLIHRRFVEQRLWSGNTDRDDDGGADSRGQADAPESSPDADGGPAAEPSGEDELTDLARERYAQAVDQWHRLPGSVSRPPAEVSGSEELLATDDDSVGDDADGATPDEPSPA